MDQVGVALLIFVLRITDVSIGTLRVLYTVRGRTLIAASLGMVEAGVFIFAISRVFKHADNPLSMLGYACGFACGTALGIRLEQWIASGLILVRVISRDKSSALLAALREAHFGITAFSGEGREGPVLMLFVVSKRKHGERLMGLIEQIDGDAFVTLEPVHRAIGGYLAHVASPAGVRK